MSGPPRLPIGAFTEPTITLRAQLLECQNKRRELEREIMRLAQLIRDTSQVAIYRQSNFGGNT